MGKMNPFIIIVQVIVLGLAFLIIILGMDTNLLNGEGQSMQFISPEGLTMPEEGYVTPVSNKMTTVTVTVEAAEDVEVHLYSASYRGGKLVRSPDNGTVIRDEWLAAGGPDERIGRDVVLSDYTTVSNYYWVRVVEPESSVPSDAEYTITIEARTTDANLVSMGVVLLGLFVIITMYTHMLSRERKDETEVARPPYASGQPPQYLAPPPMVSRPPPPPQQPPPQQPPPQQPPPQQPPYQPPMAQQQTPIEEVPFEENTSSIQWRPSTR